MLLLEKEDTGMRNGERIRLRRHLHLTLCHRVSQHILDAVAYHN